MKFVGSQHSFTNSRNLSYEVKSRTSATHKGQFKWTKYNINIGVDLTVTVLFPETMESDVQSLTSI